MREKTTEELIKVLRGDYDYFHKEIIDRMDEGVQDDDGFYTAEFGLEARQLIRSAFAYIEALTFHVKIEAISTCHEKGIPVSDPERYLIAEVRYDLNEKGDVIQRAAHIRLSDNIRFAFNMLAKAYEIKPIFNPSEEWWSCLKKSIKIRDRLMHPRFPNDLDFSTGELVDMMEAKHGFDDTLRKYPW